MVIVRAVRLGDLDQLWQLIEQATYGLTTLQINKDQLAERVELSNFAFTRKTEKATGEPYVLVMEDVSHGKLVGLSCIFSKTGGFEPFYSYRRVIESNHCELLGTTQQVESLHLEKIHDGPTEIGSLFLLPDYRGQGRGRLLSLARFAFMATHPKRFSEYVIPEMRGVMSDNGECPFWEAIGRHFFQMDFPQADSLSTINKRFIEDLMPKYPIYTSLLPESGRAILGQVHPQTVPALNMLQAEGFVIDNLIDIFDGGPVVRCRRDEIGAVKRTLTTRVDRIVDRQEGEPQILASSSDGFRSMIGPVKLGDPQLGESGATISEIEALTLQVKVGDTLRVLPLRPASE